MRSICCMKLIRVNSRQRQNVYRNHNGKLVKSDSISADAISPSEKSPKRLLHSKLLKLIAIPAIIFIVIAITAIVFLTSSSKHSSHFSTEVTPADNTTEDNHRLVPAGPGLIIEKESWGGQPALNFTKPLRHPTGLVIISHTATPGCKSFLACSQRIQNIQNYHVDIIKSPDIGYNFLIGGDGCAYVGRGWDIQNFHGIESIGICFIGNYVYDYLTSDMIKIAQKLLQQGVELGKLSRDYKLIGHNQTFSTQSPGSHIYEVIKTWPHFDNRQYIIS